MNHPICRFLLPIAFVISASSLFAQYNSDYWHQTGYLSIAAGPASPGPDLAASVSPGLMANNGLLADIDYNYMVAYGFGVGLNLGLDYFGLNQDAFLQEASPESYSCKGGFLSGRVGLNLLMNVPLEIIPRKFTLNLTAELNGGLRSYSIPDIDLFHSELDNKYTEISYRSRENVMGYAGYSTGLQFLFNNRFGVTASYSVLFATRHRINYSMRAFDAAGNLFEEEDFLSARLDRSGFQIGLLFILSDWRQKGWGSDSYRKGREGEGEKRFIPIAIGIKDSRIQRFEDSRIQGFKDLMGRWGEGKKGRKDSKIQGFKDSRIQGFEGEKGREGEKIQGFQDSRIHPDSYRDQGFDGEKGC